MEIERIVCCLFLFLILAVMLLRAMGKWNKTFYAVFECIEFVSVIFVAAMIGNAKW